MNERTDTPILLTIFGISGNLAHLKLLPALYQLELHNHLPTNYRIVGVTRQSDYNTAKLRVDIQRYLPGNTDQNVIDKLFKRIDIIHNNQATDQDFNDIRVNLEAVSAKLGRNTTRIYYLSIPAQAFTKVITRMGSTGHNLPFANESARPRVLVEKPFGYDTKSSAELITAADKAFGETQIYRIDHYLAKETAQNILTFRFVNPIFDSSWDSKHIDSITVRALEKIDIEGRADFYESTGALRDILQSHLLQLLALVTMEQPSELSSQAIHRSKLRLLRSIESIPADNIDSSATRAQYRGYRQEANNPKSITETFARLSLAIDNQQWRGTKIILETGKAMDKKTTEIEIGFCSTEKNERINSLIFCLQPEEGIILRLLAKKPGLTNSTEPVAMKFGYKDSFKTFGSEAYERVLMDAFRGDQTLFASAEEVTESWRIVEPVLQKWQKDGESLTFYSKNSSADSL